MLQPSDIADAKQTKTALSSRQLNATWTTYGSIL